MTNLIAQTKMIQPTEKILDFDSYQQLNNSQRDYTYFIAGSIDKLTNPAPAVTDPTKKIFQYCTVY